MEKDARNSKVVIDNNDANVIIRQRDGGQCNHPGTQYYLGIIRQLHDKYYFETPSAWWHKR